MSRQEKVSQTLMAFGFKEKMANKLAIEIIQNLDNYANIQDAMAQQRRALMDKLRGKK
jgi:hypothetical protein